MEYCCKNISSAKIAGMSPDMPVSSDHGFRFPDNAATVQPHSEKNQQFCHFGKVLFSFRHTPWYILHDKQKRTTAALQGKTFFSS
jgi:hypothetical protein